MVGAGQVRYNSSPWVTLRNVKYVTYGDSIITKLARIGIILDFQDMSSNVKRMSSEKPLDVVAVNRKTPVEAPLSADGRYPP